MHAPQIVVYGPIGAVLVGALLLACLVAQEQGMLPSATQTMQSPDARIATKVKLNAGRVANPLESRSRSGAVAVGSSTPIRTGSCSSNTSSSFPYVGNDIFFDFAHQIFNPGSNLDPAGPSILFMHPRHAPEFASHVPRLQHKVVLVSNSNGDECLPWAHGDNANSWRPHIDVILNSSMVAAWWGPNVVMAHPKLKHLPLGPKWNWRIPAHHAEDENKARLLAVFSKWARDPDKNFRSPKANLLFVRMTEGSSDNAVYPPSRGRRRMAVKAAQAVLASQPPPRVAALGTTQRACGNTSAEFAHVWRVEDYLFDMGQYKFVLSPVGNGVDSHRTWEALMAGSIPIVESSVRDSMYEGLPVLIVKSWTDLSLQLLQSAYANLTAAGTSYRWEKLFAPYYLQQLTADLLQSYMSPGDG